jgi:transcriptional regulator with XRE-family HTH domain
MAGQGRKPDHKRRERAARLRAKGLTYTEIAKCLGVTKQDVHQLLKYSGLWEPPQGICCRDCGVQIIKSGRGINYKTQALCLACLANHPDATFGVRLKAFRLAAGLTLKELTRRTGVYGLAAYENGTTEPKWSNLILLIRELGIELVSLGMEGKPKR